MWKITSPSNGIFGIIYISEGEILKYPGGMKMVTLLLSFGIMVVILNLHLGAMLAKRYGRWQFGVLNWGVAAVLGLTIIDKFINII